MSRLENIRKEHRTVYSGSDALIWLAGYVTTQNQIKNTTLTQKSEYSPPPTNTSCFPAPFREHSQKFLSGGEVPSAKLVLFNRRGNRRVAQR